MGHLAKSAGKPYFAGGHRRSILFRHIFAEQITCTGDAHHRTADAQR